MKTQNDPIIGVIINDIASILEVQDAYGKELNIEQFPDVLKHEYRGLWKTFLSTAICSDIKDGNNIEYSNIIVVGAFISHLLKFGSNRDVFRRGMTVDIQKVFSPLISFHIRKASEDINSTFKRYAISRDFALTKLVSVVGYETNDFINTLSNIHVIGTAVFSLDSRTSMSNAVALLSGTMFSRIPDLLSDSTIAIRQQEHLLVTALSSDVHFVPLLRNGSLELYVARSKSNSMVFKYKVELPIVYFYKNKRIEQASRRINTMWKDTFLA